MKSDILKTQTTCGLVANNVTNKLVTAEAEMKYLNWSLLSSGLLFINQYFNYVVPTIWFH
uniref:Uncharacterized protein n=1 Tax=Glossina palpalis gambiensis TaxID=67801 RepID=A0A1B0BUW6_9MUSC